MKVDLRLKNIIWLYNIKNIIAFLFWNQNDKKDMQGFTSTKKAKKT
jgi:hypothetical protein